MSEFNVATHNSNVRDRLLDVAELLAAQYGLRGLTLDRIAQRAGVSKGGLLFHFPHKAALIQAAVTRLAKDLEAAQTAAMSPDPRREGRFTRAYLTIRAQRSQSRCHPQYSALLMATGSGAQQLATFGGQVAAWKSKLENDGIDPALALIVALAADGIVLHHMLGLPLPDGSLYGEVIEQLLSMTMPDRLEDAP